MRPSTPVLACLALLVSGCLGAAPDAAPTSGSAPLSPSVAAGDRPDPTFAEVTTGPAAAPDELATLEAPPALVPGEWWRIAFESPLDGTKVEFVRVIAAVENGSYVVGMPHEGWFKEAVIYHSPGFGDVNADLSYPTHNELFQPVKFPLSDGQTWETSFSGQGPLKAEVSVGEARTALVTFKDADGTARVTLTYDAKMHEVTEFQSASHTYRVLAHGYGFEGWITIPRGENLVFLHGRFGPFLNLMDQKPAVPIESVEITGGYNRLTFIHLLGSVAGTGAYREKAVAPDGTEYVTELVGETGFRVKFFEHTDPDGTWQLEHVVGGAGIGFIEGIAYHQYDIRLPDGIRRTDHSHDVVR